MDTKYGLSREMVYNEIYELLKEFNKDPTGKILNGGKLMVLTTFELEQLLNWILIMKDLDK